MSIDEKFAAALRHIVQKYPAYCVVAELPCDNDDKDELLALLQELAELQILLVE